MYSFVLNGYRWGLIGYTSDYSTAGRYIARPYPTPLKNRPVSSRIINRLEEVVVDNGDEGVLSQPPYGIPDIKVALCSLTVNDETAAGRQDVSGNKYFWKSDYIVHHDDGYVASIKMCSDRTIGTESVDHENILGYWLPYGCTYIYNNGNEYTDIFPMWDWTKIPGVTCPDFIEPFDAADGSTMRSTQDEPFVGSAGNDDYSVTTMILDKSYSNGSVQAKKAWFNFGDEIIALGADISGGSDNILTTINQSHLAGAVTRAATPSGTAVTVAAGVMDPSVGETTSWIEHDGTAYIFPENEEVYLSTRGFTNEPWTNIGTKSGTESGNVFKAWINHGQPSSTSTEDYYYIIVPGISSSEAASYADDGIIVKLRNDEDVQAVRKNGLAGIVYYPKAPFVPIPVDLQNGLNLSTNAPCALLYDESNAENVGGNGQLDAWDIYAINRLILKNEEFQFVDSWEFVDAAHTFADPEDPFFPSTPFLPWSFPQTIQVSSFSADNDFIGIKMGDVNCEATSQFMDPCEKEVNILIKDRAIKEGNIFTVSVRAEHFKNIEAYQFSLKYDESKLEYLGLQNGDLNKGAKAESFDLSLVNSGEIKTLWLQNDGSNLSYTLTDTTLTDSSSLFLVEFKALEKIPSLAGVLGLGQDFPALAWSEGKDCSNSIELQLMPPTLSANMNSENSDWNGRSKEVYVYPNPTKGGVVFEIATDLAAERTILIYDQTGQEVFRQRVHLDKGNNTIPLEDISSWSKGLYFYTVIDSSGEINSGKFVKD